MKYIRKVLLGVCCIALLGYVTFSYISLQHTKASIEKSDMYFIQDDTVYCISQIFRSSPYGDGDVEIENVESPLTDNIRHFKIYELGYAKDKEYVYYKCEKLHNIRPSTFSGIDNSNIENLEAGYQTNGTLVFYQGKLLPGINLETFTIEPGTRVLKDETLVFKDGNRIPGADPNTYQAVRYSEYSLDINTVYRGDKKIEGADANSFTVLQTEHSFPSRYARDKNYGYFKGERLVGAIASNLNVQSETKGSCATDGVNFWLGGELTDESQCTADKFPNRRY